MQGPPNRIGIIAGGGSLPGEVAQSVVARGGAVHVVLVGDAADVGLEAYPHTRVNWAQLGRAIAAFEHANIGDVVFLGKFARPSFRNARPDLAFVLSLPAIVQLLKAGGDDAVLRGLLALFEQRGFHVVGAGEAAPELLVGTGALTRASPMPHDEADIARGFQIIAALGPYDIGQAVIVANGAIEAIEGAEGTDQMLARVSKQRRVAGSTERIGAIIKRPKPGQDLRVDLPAIGPDTVKNASAAGLAGIAVMADHVLAAGRRGMINAADAAGLFIAGVGDDEANSAQNVALNCEDVPRYLGRHDCNAPTLLDIQRGRAILRALSGFAAGSAVVVCGKRVIAIGATEPALSVVERCKVFAKSRGQRRGVAVIAPRESIDETLIVAAAAAKLSGLVILSDDVNQFDLDSVVAAAADRLGLFVAAAWFVKRGAGR